MEEEENKEDVEERKHVKFESNQIVLKEFLIESEEEARKVT